MPKSNFIAPKKRSTREASRNVVITLRVEIPKKRLAYTTAEIVAMMIRDMFQKDALEEDYVRKYFLKEFPKHEHVIDNWTDEYDALFESFNTKFQKSITTLHRKVDFITQAADILRDFIAASYILDPNADFIDLQLLNDYPNWQFGSASNKARHKAIVKLINSHLEKEAQVAWSKTSQRLKNKAAASK